MAEYIDKERLISALRETAEQSKGMVDARSAVLAIASSIEGMPSADVQPIQHGQWTNSWTDITFEIKSECSVCGKYCYSEFGTKANYCPHCGARMDEGVNDGKTM